MCFTQSAMPCRPDGEEMQRPESPNLVTPTKPPSNDGADHDNPDSERAVTDSDDDAESVQKKKRQHTVMIQTIVKRWVS